MYELNNINLAKVKLENVAAIPGNIYPAEDLVDLVDKFQGWCRPDYSSTSSVNLSTGAAEFGFDVARVGNGIKSGWIHDGNASGKYQAECINFVSFFGMTENDFLRVENFVKNITPPRNRRYYD